MLMKKPMMIYWVANLTLPYQDQQQSHWLFEKTIYGQLMLEIAEQ